MARRHIRHDIDAKGLDHTKSHSITYKGEFISNDVQQVNAQVHDAVHVSQPVAAYEHTNIVESVEDVEVKVHDVVKEEVAPVIVVSQTEQLVVEQPAQVVVEQQKNEIEMNVAVVEGAVEKSQEQKSEKKSVGKFQKKKQEVKTDVPQAGS